MSDAPRKIETIGMLNDLLAISASRPVWILKHSLICPLSSEGLREFERFAGDSPEETVFGVIEVQNARGASDELARRVGIRHETPQALLIVDGEVEWHGSHWTISAATLQEAARNARQVAGTKAK